MERRRRGIAPERIERVARDATFLREALSERARFLVVLVVLVIGAQEPSGAAAPPRASLARYDVLQFLFEARVVLGLVLPAFTRLYIRTPEKLYRS